MHPIIRDHHMLLVTLLLMNSMANEALPIFLDQLVPSWAAVLIAVTLLLFFGEILPSAVFTGPSQMRIAAAFANFVWGLQVFFYFVAKPIAWLLDNCLHSEEGHGPDGNKWSKSKLRAVMDIHLAGTPELDLTQRSLELSNIPVSSCMRPAFPVTGSETAVEAWRRFGDNAWAIVVSTLPNPSQQLEEGNLLGLLSASSARRGAEKGSSVMDCIEKSPLKFAQNTPVIEVLESLKKLPTDDGMAPCVALCTFRGMLTGVVTLADIGVLMLRDDVPQPAVLDSTSSFMRDGGSKFELKSKHHLARPRGGSVDHIGSTGSLEMIAARRPSSGLIATASSGP